MVPIPNYAALRGRGGISSNRQTDIIRIPAAAAFLEVALHSGRATEQTDNTVAGLSLQALGSPTGGSPDAATTPTLK
jgi:hypothetical protein